jgi:retron-type reverse transcriptase
VPVRKLKPQRRPLLSKEPLLQQVQKPSNLQAAWSEIKKNPRSHGLSEQTIEQFGSNLPQELRNIRRELRKGYRFGRVRAILKIEVRPDSKIKKRPLRSPEVKDRVVQRAIARVIEPFLIKRYDLLNAASFAYLRRRRMRDALVRMIELHQTGKRFILEADLENFFGSVNQQKLLSGLIFPALPDATINGLIAEGIAQEVGNLDEIAADDRHLFPESTIGIPQGGGLSPLFANVYLRVKAYASCKHVAAADT